jgi:hypothetical protein
MSSFAPRVATPRATPPDPSKHVNYNLGMVLGVDDFTQEFAYLSGRDQWLARDLLGYGTVWGLRVFTETESRGPRLVVESGVAVSPRGQLIRVARAQCAFLNDWLNLEKTRGELVDRLGSRPGDSVTAYVALCYRECPTDKVPIPGEPCRSEEDLLLPSRLTDDFVLELRFAPPDQREEDALRDFVAWLSQIEIDDAPGPFTTLQEFVEAVRNAAQLTGSPIESPPDFMFGSPPASLRIHTADACEYLRAAFRIWTTELRPRWRPTFDRGGCADGPLIQPDPEECVMLAGVVLPLIRTPTGDWAVDDTRAVAINEGRRPFLVHLRFLQEWLLCGRHATASPVGSPPIIGSPPIVGSPPLDVIVPGDAVMPETAFDQVFNAGVATEYSRADHTHGTPPDPIPLHRADVSAHTLAGDVTGAIGSTTVARLRNVDVAAIAPTPNQVLTFQGGQWQPANVPLAPGGEFVAHPAGVGSYAIVAAGIVSAAQRRAPVYNNLQVVNAVLQTGAQDALLSVTFDGYRQPQGQHQYIVKALPVFDIERGQAYIVSFDHFEQALFVLRVSSFRGDIPANLVRSIELMIEVSQFPFG